MYYKVKLLRPRPIDASLIGLHRYSIQGNNNRLNVIFVHKNKKGLAFYTIKFI
jgi:hypothetical protein